MQTSTTGFTTKFFEGFNTIKANEGWNGLYKGLGPLWCRQVPYTMVKFGAFENIVRYFYRNVFTAPKDSYSKSTQLGIVFLSGYLAGILCAIISHPAGYRGICRHPFSSGNISFPLGFAGNSGDLFWFGK